MDRLLLLAALGAVACGGTEDCSLTDSCPVQAPIEITSPTNQSNGAPLTVTEGASVSFEGSAFDEEDGPLSGGSLVWTSNRDGVIGTGRTFSKNNLSDGMHTVTLTATDSNANDTTATVLVIVKPPTSPGYQIHIRTSEGVQLSQAQRDAAEVAVAKLQSIITGDVPDITSFQFDGGVCGGAAVPPLNESVDDVIIYLEFVPIDGPNGTIGSAGPCLVRGNTFSLLGGMRFDTADLQLLDDFGLLEDIVLHEMMHVLGFGIYWDQEGLLEEPSDPSNVNYDAGMTDTHFTGANAIARFNDIGGGSYTGGSVVPVENDTTEFDTGSLDGHWREGVFGNEIMSAAANLPPNPLSVVTIGQFADLGYTVNYSAADPYTQVFSIVFGDRANADDGPTIDLSGDLWRGPIHSVASDGSLRRVR